MSTVQQLCELYLLLRSASLDFMMCCAYFFIFLKYFLLSLVCSAYSGCGGGVLPCYCQPPGLALGAARQVPQGLAAVLPSDLLPACGQYGCRHSPQGLPGAGRGGLLCLPVPHGRGAHLGFQVSSLLYVTSPQASKTTQLITVSAVMYTRVSSIAEDQS